MNVAHWFAMLDRVGFEVARVLLSLLWQSSILLVAAGLLALALRGRRASARHAVWAVAVLTVPLLPLLGWALGGAGSPRVEIPVMPAYSVPAMPEPVPLPVPQGDVSLPPRATPSFTRAVPVAPLSPGDYPWAFVLLAYAVGAGGFMSLVALGWLRIQRWGTQGAALTAGACHEVFESARAALRLGRRCRVVASPKVPTPMTVGIFRPAVLLPSGLAERLAPNELGSVALHELAHLKRHDPLFLALASLVRALLFFHPLVWVAARQLAGLAEAACDDAVLDAGEQPVSYAKMLVRLAEELPRRSVSAELAAGIVLSRSAFLRRVQAILSERRDRIRRLTRVALAATLVAAVV
jgi:Zn-dependent protease with chaperone function